MKLKRIVLGSFLLLSAVAMGAQVQPTKAERAKMAKVHDEVAACLRSDKPMQECHKIMMNGHMANQAGCRAMFDSKECPFGGHGGMMHGSDGMMQGQGMMEPNATSTAPAK